MPWSAQRRFRRFGVALLFLLGSSLLLPWCRADAAAKRPAVDRATASKSAAHRAVHRKTRTAKASTRRATSNKQRPRRAVVAHAAPAPARPSIGHAFGLHAAEDPLSLQSAAALVLDQRTGDVLFEKNAQAVLPIASISKLMTAMVVLDAHLPMDEVIEITEADVDTERNSRSRLRTGTNLTRRELLQLALMSSENRAAHALGRNHPGGMTAFVAQMNRKAHELGMSSSGFVEPTGLSSSNVSSARDLARLVQAAFRYPLIREYSTASALSVEVGRRVENYRNTNRLVDRRDWDIGLQKTGFISEAGNCLVMQARIDDRPLVLVLLDAQARAARIIDATRIRHWVERMPSVDVSHVSQPAGREKAPRDDSRDETRV